MEQEEKYATTEAEMLEHAYEVWNTARDLLKQMAIMSRIDPATALVVDDTCRHGDHYILWCLSNFTKSDK